MADQEMNLEQLKYMQGVYGQEYEALAANINSYVSLSAMMSRNIEFIENVERVKGSNMLLNLEAGTYIEVKASNTDKVFTYVGFGYVVEKSKDEAKAFLEENRKKTDEIVKKLTVDREKIETELMSIELKLNSMPREE